MNWADLATIHPNPSPAESGQKAANMAAATKYTDNELTAAINAYQAGQDAGRHDIQPGTVFRTAYVAADESGHHNAKPNDIARNMFVQGYLSVLPACVQIDYRGRVTLDCVDTIHTLIGVGLIG